MKIQAFLIIFIFFASVFSNEGQWNFTKTFPLRIPEELKSYYFHEINHQQFRPKRSEGERQDKQLVPGVYSLDEISFDRPRPEIMQINPRLKGITMVYTDICLDFHFINFSIVENC